VLDTADQAHPEPAPETGNARESDLWRRYQRRLLQAIAAFDDDVLNETYTEVLSLYPVDIVTSRLTVPLLRELGERWVEGRGSIAEEHFFSVFLRNRLGARFHHLSRNRRGPKLLAACLPGEQHEVGLLLFALAAHDHGFRLVLLGADTPLAELPYAARRAQAEAIVLSGSIDPRPGLLDTELPKLATDAGLPVFIGGLTAVRHRDAIVAAGAEPLGSDITAGLKRIGEALAPAAP